MEDDGLLIDDAVETLVSDLVGSIFLKPGEFLILTDNDELLTFEDDELLVMGS